MPFDSNGVFSRVMNWTSDQQNGIAIECGRHDEEDDNFAEGFNDCFCRDGRAPATGDFNLGNNKIKNLANGTASTDAINKSQLDAQNTSLTAAFQNYVKTILGQIYPVGSLYIGTQTTCPMSTLISGSTWELVATDKALWGGTGSNANTTIAAGLPNITGQVGFIKQEGSPTVRNPSGAFSSGGEGTKWYAAGDGFGDSLLDLINFNASSSNQIYGNSNTVQPPAYVVNVWRRTA